LWDDWEEANRLGTTARAEGTALVRDTTRRDVRSDILFNRWYLIIVMYCRTRRKRDVVIGGDVETGFQLRLVPGCSRLSGSSLPRTFPHDVMSLESKHQGSKHVPLYGLTSDSDLLSPNIIQRPVHQTIKRSAWEQRDETRIRPSKSIYVVI
jgi:hypothetical protein